MSQEINVTEAEIIEGAKRIKVFEPPANVPREMHAIYARQAIVDQLVHEKTIEAEREAHRQREKDLAAALEANKQKMDARRKTEAETKREKDHEDFLKAVVTAFFAANPHADKTDWERNKKQLIDAAMQQRTLDALRGNETDIESIKTRFRESGTYGF